ncbi:MAG: T9SS type A sorting domain-containing protein [bacterium]|nr:T9SS type A sorting domain-containing protein [bacterium]
MTPHMRQRLLLLLVPVVLLGCAGAARATVVHADSAEFLLDIVSAVDGPSSDLPAMTRVTAASPNPFNPGTTITFELAVAGPVELSIHDLQGRLVQTIATGTLAAGHHQAAWNGRDRSGQGVASGTYLCRLVAAGGAQSLKLVLAK